MGLRAPRETTRRPSDDHPQLVRQRLAGTIYTHLGKFEDWCRVIGGILEAARIGGFLGNLDELYSGVDAESPEWEGFLSAWLDCYGITEQAPNQIEADLKANRHPALSEALPGDMSAALNDPRGSFAKRFGRALAKRVDRRYGDRKFRLIRGGSVGRTRCAGRMYRPASTPSARVQRV